MLTYQQYLFKVAFILSSLRLTKLTAVTERGASSYIVWCCVEVWDSVHADPPSREGFTIFPVLLHPRSRGVVSLRTTDPADPPLIDPRYLTDDADLKILAEGRPCTLLATGNETVPKIIINNTISLFLAAISLLLISNHNWFRVLFDRIPSVYFI